ncbi:hypothetical protein HMPREF0322_01108 [Desulfitobacterium hafniense DP7]|uniref:Uncharacterized protein n=2 Tax=Desulfitobacterium hafniense TaxID=49338 RepID=A0A0W1JJ75_DESHA|nr:hypothetical protein [Desulfitobacterium hafniense]EHL08121.1 hypothetical protein HMPREF0322_01108 [Desulfitobacterium hafniense DP7]KTE91748.1 hypothetical protein AT727_20500 [Desulfitobacterium hafniense]
MKWYRNEGAGKRDFRKFGTQVLEGAGKNAGAFFAITRKYKLDWLISSLRLSALTDCIQVAYNSAH